MKTMQDQDKTNDQNEVIELSRDAAITTNTTTTNNNDQDDNDGYMDNQRRPPSTKYKQERQQLAPEDLFSGYTNPRNYLKSIFFITIYWITLAVVLVAGATKVSLLSLGYLIGCFIFLWLGNDTYLMPLKKLTCRWNCFIIYAALVIITKITLQFTLCNQQEFLSNHCYIQQLLGIVCKASAPDPSVPVADQAQLAMCAQAAPTHDQLDLIWDVLCLVFLILQRVVFASRYFTYLVQDVKAQQILASRGAELIMATQIEEAKAQALYEKEVMRNIRAKMDDLKTDNEETSKAWRRLLLLPHHFQVIRNADKHLFTSMSDDSPNWLRTDDWKFKRAFIPDPLGDELERMSEINGISAVFTRWMKGGPLYGSFHSGARHYQQGTASASYGSPEQGGSQKGAAEFESQGAEQQQQSSSSLPGQLQKYLATGGSTSSYNKLSEEDDDDDEEEGRSEQDEHQSELDEKGQRGRFRAWLDLISLLVYSVLLSATVELNKLSRSFRYVSRQMTAEKNALKRRFNLDDERFKRDPIWRKWAISTLAIGPDGRQRGAPDAVHLSTSLRRIRSALRAITAQQTTAGSGNSQPSMSLTSPSSSSSSPPPPPPTSQPIQRAGHLETTSASVVGHTESSRSALPSTASITGGGGGQKTALELTDPEYQFLKLNMFTQFCRALAYVFISNTSLLCQLVIIFNQVYTASLLSLPLPLLTFFWGTLSVPRPTKRFWKFVITYTELIIVVKYVFQFPIWNWDLNNINPFYYPNLFGIKDITILYDLTLLLVLFFHRSMLKSLGQWDASGRQDEEKFALMSTSQSNTPDSKKKGRSPASGCSPETQRIRRETIPRVSSGNSVLLTIPNENETVQENGASTVNKQATTSSANQLEQADGDTIRDNTAGVEQAIGQDPMMRSPDEQHYIENAYQTQKNDGESPNATAHSTIAAIDGPELYDMQPKNCFSRTYCRIRRSITLFFRHVLYTPYKVQTDVYTWMFLCDFINFLILIYGFWAFGSGYTNQTVASFLNENRIPFSVLIMLLAQFASIIVDRAFYLQKNITGKLMFQLLLVIGIHIWLFFLLPFTTGHTLALKEYWPPKAWYIFKCIYFLLSAHQIRCGYPRRVLGNCLTKGYGYANWAAFKFYRAIPLVYDLRLYMDWIWTETTLEFRNWSLMEDMFANLFIRKCELTLEEEFPTPRARPIKHLSKYLTGGAFILLILAIIWGPLLLFSMGKTVGESNPPVEMEYELEIVGFQPILRMRATAQQMVIINDTQYDQMKKKFVSLSSQSFLGDYKLGDVAAIQLDGQSNAVWEISPPSKDTLIEQIKNNETFTLKSSWTIFRIKKKKSQNFDTSIVGTYQRVIDGDNSSQDFRTSLKDMLQNSSTTADNPTALKYVITPAIFPNYIRVPETGQANLVDQFYDNLFEYQPLRPLKLTYIRMYDKNTSSISSTSWWKAEDLCKYNLNNDSFPFWSEPGSSLLPHCDKLLVVAFNDRIFTGILALLSAPGIIGIYTTFVVFFARLIRTEPSGKVIYTEIPNVDRVYGLLMDIYMARESGEFELEEKLFAKLLFLYRSPEMLIDFSRREDEPQPELLELESPR